MKGTVDDILKVPFSSRSQDEKLRIISEGKPRPSLNMASAITMDNSESESGELCVYQFNLSMYDEVKWLTGCEKRDTFFCWPCLLFMPAAAPWNTTGVSDLVYFLECKNKHEESTEHVQSMLKLQDMIELNAKMSNMDVCEHNEIVKRNRAILKRMIDVVCNLLIKERSFFERKNGCELDPENCARNLKFLRTYDVLNCNYIEDALDLIEISPNIVNDLVNTISKGIKMAIAKEIQQSTYVSVILSDHSKLVENPQISTVLRYLKGGKVCERFIGYTNMGRQKSLPAIFEHITNVLANVLQGYMIEDKFLAVALDGGILQTTELEELNIMLMDRYPFNFFVPWYGHGLDDVLQQSLANMKECRSFMKAMNEMKNFFHKKSKRFKSLNSFMAGCKIVDTGDKWFVKSQLIQVVNMFRKNFVQFFESMLQSSTMWDSDDISKALGFVNILEDFWTVFLLETLSRLFSHTAILNKMLKSSTPEKVFNSREVTALNINLVTARDKEFEEVWSEVHVKFSKEKIDPAAKKVKLDLDNPTVMEYRKLYESVINRMIQELNVRFTNLGRLSFCQLLNCDKSGKFVHSDDLMQTLMNVQDSSFDEEQLTNELTVLRTNTEVFAKKSVYDILDFLIQAKLKSAFKYVYKLAELILTLPAKPPSEEVDKAKYKEIKDWSYFPKSEDTQPGDVSVPCVEVDFLQEMKKSSSFHDEIAVIFYSINKTFELLHK